MTGSKPASGPSRNDGVKFASGPSRVTPAGAESQACEHSRIGKVRWDIAPHSVLVDCADCGAEATVALDWDDREWGED